MQSSGMVRFYYEELSESVRAESSTHNGRAQAWQRCGIVSKSERLKHFPNGCKSCPIIPSSNGVGLAIRFLASQGEGGRGVEILETTRFCWPLLFRGKQLLRSTPEQREQDRVKGMSNRRSGRNLPQGRLRPRVPLGRTYVRIHQTPSDRVKGSQS